MFHSFLYFYGERSRTHSRSAKIRVMLKVKDLHLCDYAFIAEGGKLGLIGIFDRVGVAAVPAVINPFHVVADFGSDTEYTTEIELTILDPEDKALFNVKGLLKLQAGKSHNFLAGIAGFKIEKPGTYTVRFMEKGNELARMEFPVLIVDQNAPRPR